MKLALFESGAGGVLRGVVVEEGVVKVQIDGGGRMALAVRATAEVALLNPARVEVEIDGVGRMALGVGATPKLRVHRAVGSRG